MNPFTIDIPQSVLDDLHARLATTRWATALPDTAWSYGTDDRYLRDLVAYWQDGYDWRKTEASLNAFSHFIAEVDGTKVHFIHERGKGPNPMPLLLLHGWPDSFYRMAKIIPMLTDPAAYGGDPADSFDVIVPSLPGFGFSDQPRTRGWSAADSAALLTRLMTEGLGYAQFAVHGGDTGSPLAQLIAIHAPDHVTAIHLTDIGWHATGNLDPATLSEAEQEYMGQMEYFSYTESAYVMIQGTKPQTLAYGLNDSPVGLASWILDLFYKYSDCHGDLGNSYTQDEMLTNIMIYWVTQSINASMRGYYEGMHTEAFPPGLYVNVPVGLTLFPADFPPPREMGERSLNVQHWNVMPRGGHFAAMETPDLLVEDMWQFFRTVRGKA